MSAISNLMGLGMAPALASKVTVRDPDTVTVFGGTTAPSASIPSLGTFPDEGNLYREIVGAGRNPASTGADVVVGVYSIPAYSFDVSGRGICVLACGSFAATGNNKRIKIILNPSTAVLGSTVGGGGTTVCDTGTVTQNGGGWQLQAVMFKYGAAGSNTQLGINQGTIVGTSHQGVTAPQAITATESGAILVAITANATTAATDIIYNFLEVNAMN